MSVPLHIVKSSMLNSKIIIPTYNKPECKDTAVILPYFNVTGSIRIQQNILYILHLLKTASIPHFVGEMTFCNEQPFFEESDTTFLFRSHSYMFYKEHIINLVLQKPCAQEFAKYILLDADIVFKNPNWVDAISNALDSHDILQPYEHACMLSKNFTVMDVKHSCCKTKDTTGHVGYVWAFRRDWYSAIGLFEHALTGGGDTVLAYKSGVIDFLQEMYTKENLKPELRTRFTYLPGCVYHLPHGSMTNRQYSTRYQKIKDFLNATKLAKLSDATQKEDGILVWKPEYRTQMNNILYEYFKNRKDDEFD